VRTAVEYIVREGVCACAPEAVQLLVARELLTVLGAVANLATPGLGFQPLLNEHQLQALALQQCPCLKFMPTILHYVRMYITI
jgi:hypothetical protein